MSGPHIIHYPIIFTIPNVSDDLFHKIMET